MFLDTAHHYETYWLESANYFNLRHFFRIGVVTGYRGGMLNLYSVCSTSNVRRLCALLCPAISFLHFYVLQFHVLQFHALQIGPSISRPSFSRPAFSAPSSKRLATTVYNTGDNVCRRNRVTVKAYSLLYWATHAQALQM